MRVVSGVRFLRWVAVLIALPAANAEPVDILLLDGFEADCGRLIYSEPFSGANGSAWPSPWTAIGNVETADVQQSAARLRPHPTNYSLARMYAPVDTRNVELRFALRMEDIATQGVGFYVRQNGGYLTQTNGRGYAVFTEGSFRNAPGVSVWKEENGTEIELAHAPAPNPAMASGVEYRVRFQVLQLNSASTRLRARLWPSAGTEPVGWQTSFDDPTAVLQNISGGIAVDSWSVRQPPAAITAHTFVDSVEIISLCQP
ncbi:hypothetical protein [Tahibacter amnicola]|uniref:Uncharacterized protein n=1 Tax=Tahibacter amnicola TaxID=2976241 RepID=A0ABY6BF70_9GAMM|nr:hypothetical protein [Tahibacter amnicola]UXI67000.1 hypothetical protein N4264_19935 [Tahibacter amnicola]